MSSFPDIDRGGDGKPYMESLREGVEVEAWPASTAWREDVEGTL